MNKIKNIYTDIEKYSKITQRVLFFQNENKLCYISIVPCLEDQETVKELFHNNASCVIMNLEDYLNINKFDIDNLYKTDPVFVYWCKSYLPKKEKFQISYLE